jgi:alpha-galactosidase
MSTGTTTPTPARVSQEIHVAMLPNETYQATTATTTNGRVILVSVETISTDRLILSDETVDTVARLAENEQVYQDFRPTVYCWNEQT